LLASTFQEHARAFVNELGDTSATSSLASCGLWQKSFDKQVSQSSSVEYCLSKNQQPQNVDQSGAM
jgi:hypothetical protein